MSSVETQDLGHANRTLKALSLALRSGTALGDVEIDLADPAECRFGAYTLVARIGGGGMGVVYRAHQASLERDVAIKLLNVGTGADAEALARFQFEAKSAAALNHPNIVQVLEIGEEQGVAFIAMQLVRGTTLADRLDVARMPREDAVAMMIKLCDAVGYAHKLRLLHLDLKPSNVLIDERGEPLVADFGLARRMNANGQVQAQEVSGTPAYMAPEQMLIKEFRLSAATDIYALGAILYETLCGAPPHGRGAPADAMQRALAGRIPAPRSIDASVPRDLEAICLKCLGLRAEERYASVEQLAEDLRRFANALPVSVRAPTLRERVQRWYAREPRFAFAMTALLVVAAAGAIVMTRLYERSEFERAGADGLIRLLMLQKPHDEHGILYTEPNYRWPLVDCALGYVRCNGDLQRQMQVDPSLPRAESERRIASLAAYVDKVAAWGDARLSAQLADVVDSAHHDLYRFRRAQAAAATGTVDGLVFAYMMSFTVDHDKATPQSHEWLDAALKRIDRPWQAQLLAENCDAPDPLCDVAIARFRELDADNAAAWIVALPDHPTPDADRALLRAAAATHLHRAEGAIDAALVFAERLMPALDANSRVSASVFAMETAGYASFLHYPDDYCTRSLESRDAPEIEAACLAIFRRADPELKRGFRDEVEPATALIQLSSDAAERAQAWQRLRNARWIYSAQRQLPIETGEAAIAERIRVIRDRGNLAWIRERVAKAGLPVEAPETFVTPEPLPWPRHKPAT